MQHLITGIDPAALQRAIRSNVQQAIAEDLGTGDVSAALIDSSHTSAATVITRDAGIFCGKLWAIETCRQIDEQIELEFMVDDGDSIAAGDRLFTLRGRAASLLSVERTMLNFIQLLSGTATRTRDYLEKIAHTQAMLLDTRKTIPGLRLAQKYAVRCAGGHNHRLGLYDAYLIKENHITASGSITRAVKLARQQHPELKVEVEVETLEQLSEAISVDADIAMVDNFSLEQTRQAVELADGRIALESSGGINEKTITEIAEAGVDYISVGSLTKDIQPLDLSMRMEG